MRAITGPLNEEIIDQNAFTITSISKMTMDTTNELAFFSHSFEFKDLFVDDLRIFHIRN